MTMAADRRNALKRYKETLHAEKMKAKAVARGERKKQSLADLDVAVQAAAADLPPPAPSAGPAKVLRGLANDRRTRA
jgi:hypothetical protein